MPRRELEFFNGLGGFADGGREYVTVLGPGQSTPAPWLNVIANASFGFQVSESGSGYTWSGNSRENQLTPWSNDPVSDPVSEAIYVRDDDTGELWCPTALPIRCEESTYVARHGAGYSRFEHLHDGIQLDLVQFVPLDDAVKVSVLTIENRSGRSRRLSVTAYAEWALGTSRGASAPRIVTALDPETQALLVRNPWNAEFGGRVAFLDLGGRQTAWTADRTEFLGRNGAPGPPGRPRPRAPAAREPSAPAWIRAPRCRPASSSPTGRGPRSSCCSARRPIRPTAIDLIRRGRAPTTRRRCESVATYWDDTQGTIQVRTPDRSMDIMLNRWLIYQTLACRMWARTAFYQAGGAYGFRDQLQDVIALVTAEARARPRAPAAGRGPPVRRGRRPALVAPAVGPRGANPDLRRSRLAAVRGRSLPRGHRRHDSPRRGRAVPRGPELAPGRDGRLLPAGRVDQVGFAVRPLRGGARRSLAVGVHGLPLIGSGDWNDGMNRVGHEGRGESVWLGWFLHIRAGRLRADRRGARRPARGRALAGAHEER